MSITRWIVRGLLVLILLLVIWAGYKSQMRQHPDYYWDKAQAALKAGAPKAAKIHLQNLVKEFPKDARGHRGLAAELVKEANLPETAEGYAAYPAALNELIEAGRLNEDDLEFQKLVLSACLRAGRVSQAAAAAGRVAKAEPQNADAIFARAWQAAETEEAEKALKLLDQLPDGERDAFRALGLRAQVLSAKDAKDPRFDVALDAITARAGQLTSEQIAALNDAEFAAMVRYLPISVSMSNDRATGERRAGDCVNVCERLSELKTKRTEAAQGIAAQITALLTAKFTTLTATPEQAASRQQLSDRLNKLLAKGAAVEKPNLIVAFEAAQLAFDKGEFAATVALLDKALAAHKADKRAKPEQAQAIHFLAARALLGMQRYREASEHLANLVEDKKTSGVGQLMLGAIAMSEGRNQDALTNFTRAERELGANPLVRISLAQTLLNLGKWEDSLPYLGSLHDELQLENPEVQAWLKQMQLTDVKVHLQEARALFALKRGAEAEKHLAALANTDLEPQAIELRVDALIAEKKPDQADALLAQGLTKFPQNVGLIGKRVGLLQLLKKPEEALALLTNAVAQAPDDLRLQLLLAQTQSQAGKNDEALTLLTALEQKHPDAVAILLVRADVLIKAGRTDEANALAERIHNLPSSGALGSLVGALAALRANDPKRAADNLKGEAGDNLQLRHLEGEAAAVTGDFPAAIAALGESIRVTSLRGRAGPLLCYCVAKLAEKEGPAAAQRTLAPVLAAASEEPFVLMAQADVLTMQLKFEQALAVLDRLEQIEKESAVGPQLRAAVLSRMNQPATALKECQRALAKDPKFVPSLALAAQLQYALQNYAAAAESAQAVLDLSPDSWQLAVLKSEAQWAAGKMPDAIATTQQLIARQPELVDGPRQLVNLYTRAGQYEPALTACQQARGKFKDDAGLAVQEIILLHLTGKGDPNDALAKQFVGEPASAAKALALAGGFAALKDYPHAEQWGQAALKAGKDKEVAAAHLFLGNLGLAENAARPDRKLLAAARDQFAAVLKDIPGDFVAGNNLAWLLAVDFDQPADAIPIIERTRGEAPVARLPLTFIDTMATVYRRAGETTKAAMLLEQAVAAHPDEALLKFHLGMTLGQMGPSRARDAQQFLRDSLTATLTASQIAEAKQELQRLAAAEVEAAANADKEAVAKEAAAIAAAEAREAAKNKADSDAKAAAEKKKTK